MVKKMKCKRCDEKENRINGFCSVYCEDMAFVESERDYLLNVIKAAYRKHHLDDASIGWGELYTMLHDAICNTIGDDGYLKWMKELKKQGICDF